MKQCICRPCPALVLITEALCSWACVFSNAALSSDLKNLPARVASFSSDGLFRSSRESSWTAPAIRKTSHAFQIESSVDESKLCAFLPNMERIDCFATRAQDCLATTAEARAQTLDLESNVSLHCTDRQRFCRAEQHQLRFSTAGAFTAAEKPRRG